MDSKIKKITILSVSFFLLLVLGIVLILNGVTSSFNKEKQTNKDLTNTVSHNGFVNGDQLSEEELRAFLNDEFFFDQEENARSIENKAIDLSLQVTSVEKDLRIMIVNNLGQLVSGESFFVDIEDVGQYKDLDKDGVIYIGDVPAGEYFVSLEDIKGYQVPPTQLKVNVKDKVSYEVIEDIGYLIKTEDEIDALLEDTEVNEADLESDDTESTTTIEKSDKFVFGIDVSKWNKEIDWNRVANAGVEFAIIRCGYRGSKTGALVEDPYFLRNIEGAKAAGIKVGIYFFTQATNEVEGVEEASMVIALSQGYDLEYPVFIDTEGAGGNGRADQLDKVTRTKSIKAFCKTMEAAGYKTGIYASKNWLLNNIQVQELSEYHIWLAEYKDEPTYEGDYQIWQYTSKGNIEGIDGRVDFNVSYLK